jgi:ABC-type transport system involved in multi-copper enzyme maturation permease subunit
MSPLTCIRLEWIKFSRNGTCRVAAGFYVAFFAVLVFLAFKVGANMTFSSNGQTVRPAADLFEFPRCWELVAYMGSWMNVLVAGFLGLYMTSSEWAQRTLRQSVVNGMERAEVLRAKLLGAAVLAAGATVVFLLIGVLTGLASSGVGAGWVPPPDLTARFYLQALGYALLGMLAAHLIRSTALATIAYLAYVFFIELVLRWIVYFTVTKHHAIQFMPDRILECLVPFPTPKAVEGMASGQKLLDALAPGEAVVAALVVVALAAGFIRARLLQRDL